MTEYEGGEPYDNSMGEHFNEDLGRSIARHVNAKLKRSPGEFTYIELFDLGEHSTQDVRFRDSPKPGFLTAYIRTKEAAAEHKAVTITASAIAIGAVLAGIYALKYRKR